MAFSIELLAEPAPELEPGVRACLGAIKIGDFEERFVASLMYWQPEDYRHHWEEAITRIVEGADRSCLITSIVDPASSKFLFWWPMYRAEKTVLLQNQILFFDQLSSRFDPSNPFINVHERRTINVDGEPISEWSASIEEMSQFLLS